MKTTTKTAAARKAKRHGKVITSYSSNEGHTLRVYGRYGIGYACVEIKDREQAIRLATALLNMAQDL